MCLKEHLYVNSFTGSHSCAEYDNKHIVQNRAKIRPAQKCSNTNSPHENTNGCGPDNAPRGAPETNIDVCDPVAWNLD